MSKVCTTRRKILFIGLGFAVILIGYIITLKQSSITKERTGRETNLTALTDYQKTVLKQFRKRQTINIIGTEQYLRFDVFLLKWLEVAKFDVDEADELVAENIAWKKAENIYDIHHEDFTDIAIEYEFNVDELDLLGRPVLFLNMGALDFKKVIKTGKKDLLLRYLTKKFDEAVNKVYKSYENGNDVTQYLLLVQMQGFTFSKGICIQCMTIYIEMTKLYEKKYPMMTYRVLIINAPGIFSAVMAVTRPIISEESSKRVIMLGKPDIWEPVLAQMGINQLKRN